MNTLVFGHKNPDTDSVAAAIAVGDLKRKLGYDIEACILDDINRETEYVLDYFGLEIPRKINNVKIQIRDLNYDKNKPVKPGDSIKRAYRMMKDHGIKILPVTDAEDKLTGIATMKDIAVALASGDVNIIASKIGNIASDLKGHILNGCSEKLVSGKIMVGAFHQETLRKSDLFRDASVVIVGDRYDVIEYAIEKRVELIILTGGNALPEKYLKLSKENNISIILTQKDTLAVARTIDQSNFISSIMKSENISKFSEEEYLDDFINEIRNNKHSNYPIVSTGNEYLGFANRRHIMTPGKKKVILVDHNEYSQSVDGLEQAEILEIIDHHKIGDISTDNPIIFRNYPYGSTCTIVYEMYKEKSIEIPYEIKGLLLSGIVSDTLYLNSPTSTIKDSKAIEELNNELRLDLDKYSMDMYRAGTSLEGKTLDEIFTSDLKTFNLEGKKVQISQVMTLDKEKIFEKKEELLDFIFENHEKNNNDLTLFMLTDIERKGSYIFYAKDKDLLENLKANIAQGDFLEGIMSRKKQILPDLIQKIRSL